MRMLAEAIGMSTGALFGHFKSKESIWTASVGVSPPNFKLAEQIALLQASGSGTGWLLCSLPDGQFEAHHFGDGGIRIEAVADTPDAAIAALLEQLPEAEPHYILSACTS